MAESVPGEESSLEWSIRTWAGWVGGLHGKVPEAGGLEPKLQEEGVLTEGQPCAPCRNPKEMTKTSIWERGRVWAGAAWYILMEPKQGEENLLSEELLAQDSASLSAVRREWPGMTCWSPRSPWGRGCSDRRLAHIRNWSNKKIH